MSRRLTVRLALAAATFGALPAAALSPEDAAFWSQRLGRPLPSKIEMAQPLAAPADAPRIMFAPGGAPLPIYLNRHGGHYECGGFDEDSSQNHSTVVCNNSGGGSADIGGFSGSDSQWNTIKTCVSDQFAQFNVYITDVEPTSGEYVEAVVGGSPDQAGMPFGVGGVAPYFCEVISSAVVYAFADVYGNDTRGICETTTQEIAHAFGLDHEFLCQDPMTYLDGCGAKSFQDTYASCGEFEPRECSCGGASQNSVQSMLQLLGPSDGSPPPPPPNDQENPEVTLLSPQNGASLESNSRITVEANATDDIGLTVVELQWDYSGENMFCPGEGGAWSCTKSGNRYSWSIQVGEGSRTFRVHVRDVAGNEALSDDATIWLGAEGEERPDDAAPPDILIATPLDGAQLPANETLTVVATIADDSGIARAELVWPFNEGIFACPMQSDGINCSVDGTTYVWTLQVGNGARSFSVRAVDLVGNVVETPERTISLVAGLDLPVDDGNDTIDQAQTLECGDTIDVTVQDADWFIVDAPDGQRVTVAVEGEAAGQIALVATTGPRSSDVVADGSEAVSFWATGDEKIGVVPARADAGSYTLVVECQAPEAPVTPSPFGCAQAGSAAGLWLGLLGLLRLRRRR